MKLLWQLILWFCVFAAVDATVRTYGNTTVALLWYENDTCSEIHNVPSSLKCKFVKNVTNCQPDGGLINYLVFTHCWMPNNLIPLSTCLLFIWLLYLFVFLGETAENYLCPALKVMSKNLQLNQNLAGVTLLALGNGAPDIFGAYVAITQAKQGSIGLAIGAIFGSGIFVTTVVVGSIVLSSKFTLTTRPFLRDVIFYIIAVFCSFYTIWDQRMYWWEGAGFVAIYVAYVLVVLLGRLIYQKFLKKKLGRGNIPRANTPAEDEELEDPASFPNNGTRFSASVASDHHSLNNVLLSPGGSSREFPLLKEEIEESEDDDQDNQLKPISNLKHDQGSDYNKNAIVLPNLGLPTIDLKCNQGSQDIESQSNVNQSTDNDDITSDCPGFSPTIVPSQANGFRNIQGTISGDLEVYGEVDMSPISGVAQSFLHMHRHLPNSLNQESNTAETTPLLLAHCSDIVIKKHPVVKMLEGLSPIDCSSFKNKRLWWKIVIVIKIPVNILLAATIPLVDDSKKDHSWNKWLNICHCAISPCFIVLITQVGLMKIVGVMPLIVIPAAVGLLAAVTVALTSRNDHHPRYHFLFAWLGFAVAIVWIYSLANEIVSILQALGVIIDLTDAVLGLTLLAWGNSIGDAISNYTMGKQGFPRIGIAACFGGPLLNMLIGIGVPSIVQAIKSGGYFRIDLTDVELICVSFLLMSLLFSLVTVTLVLRFKMHRLYGVCLIILYICFMIMAVLAGTKVIKLKHSIEN